MVISLAILLGKAILNDISHYAYRRNREKLMKERSKLIGKAKYNNTFLYHRR
jgi:hypothetical protein